jgi:hypothetical protein
MVNTENILNEYQTHVQEVMASFSSALKEVGNPAQDRVSPEHQFLVASMANAIQELTASLSIALSQVGGDSQEKFRQNSDHFRSKLKNRAQIFVQFFASKQWRGK